MVATEQTYWFYIEVLNDFTGWLRMKLCIVTPCVLKGDGQGRVNYEIAWEAIRRGHHVTLLASRVAPELQHNSQVKWIDIPVKGWSTYLLREIVFAWQSADWLRKHRSELDLVQANGAITWAQDRKS